VAAKKASGGGAAAAVIPDIVSLHPPGLGRAATGRDDRVGEAAAGDRGMGRDEGMAVVSVCSSLAADRRRRFVVELAAEGAARQLLAMAVEHEHAAADSGGDRRGDLLEAALLEDEALEPALHRDPALQDLVLLVDEVGEGLLGQSDERHRVGDLEQREALLLGLVGQCLRQLGVIEAGAEPEPGEVVIGEAADEGALLGGALELDARREDELTAGEPGGRVLELGDVHPANRALAGALASGQFEPELVEQALDAQHR